MNAKCQICQTELKPLLTSMYCPNEGDHSQRSSGPEWLQVGALVYQPSGPPRMRGRVLTVDCITEHAGDDPCTVRCSWFERGDFNRKWFKPSELLPYYG